eukprot:365673-Chlamydomonas_euryale.AAC.3
MVQYCYLLEGLDGEQLRRVAAQSGYEGMKVWGCCGVWRCGLPPLLSAPCCPTPTAGYPGIIDWMNGLEQPAPTLIQSASHA